MSCGIYFIFKNVKWTPFKCFNKMCDAAKKLFADIKGAAIIPASLAISVSGHKSCQSPLMLNLLEV